MEKILVFKTSTDKTIKRLLDNLGDKAIDCLIQSSQLERYKALYPYIHFIDICQEGFYDLPCKVVDQITLTTYDQVYITFSDMEGYNYGNVLELLEKTTFRNACFYNCAGDKLAIPKQNIIRDTLCRIYIEFTGFLYEIKEKLLGCAQ